jgi:hypothetical protein
MTTTLSRIRHSLWFVPLTLAYINEQCGSVDDGAAVVSARYFWIPTGGDPFHQ